MVRGNVVKVRLSDAELRQLDAAVARRGTTRAGVLRDGLQTLVAPASLDEMLSTFGPAMDWRVAAATLEEQYPERWGEPDPAGPPLPGAPTPIGSDHGGRHG